MTTLEAIAFGVVQGLGEFLPISSSAHLVVLPWALGWRDPGLAFDVALHLGTLLALLVYFRRDLTRLALALLRSVVERRIAGDPERRLAWLVVLGSLPAGLLGLLFERAAEEHLRSPSAIAVAMIVLGVLLYVVDRRAQRARPLESLTLRDALLIGFAQAAAIVPGVSRSGATITMGRLLGLGREASARFSFLLSAPIVAGAGLLKVPRLVKSGGLGPDVWIGIAVAAVTGYLAIELLLRVVRSRSYLPFAVYRAGFGVAVLLLVFARR